MRKILNAVCVLVVSLTPTFANPPLCEVPGRYQTAVVSTASKAEEEVQAEPSIFILSEPRKVKTFRQFSVRFAEASGERRMVVEYRQPAPEWAKVSKSSL